ncbi:hypothetical protein K2W90_02700 [Candidatus Babeliales bacterium]|nr:hypothetical protein [Candidatus Babeliales bacterium]
MVHWLQNNLLKWLLPVIALLTLLAVALTIKDALLIIVTFSTPIISGLFFKLIDNCNKQGEFVATMKALKNECQYNKIYRGDNKNPFQLYWLEKALSHLNFYQQCNEIVQLALPLFELAKDCNIGQLEPRKDEAGQKIVPRDLQNQMIYIATKINEVIPELEKRTTWYGYLKFIYTSK